MNMILFTIDYLLATLHGFVHKRNPAKLHLMVKVMINRQTLGCPIGRQTHISYCCVYVYLCIVSEQIVAFGGYP